MDKKSDAFTGIILLVISALFFSTAGLFVKGLKAGVWEIIFWRGVFAFSFTLLWTCWQRRFRVEFIEMKFSGFLVALAAASGTFAFIPAFKLTSIANVSLIYATVPLFAGLGSWIWAKEVLTKKMMFCITGAIIGVAIIVMPSLQAPNLAGDLLALWMTLSLAGLIVLYRIFPETPAAGPAALSSLLLLPIAFHFGQPFSISGHEIMIAGLFGLVFAIASVTLAAGSKRVEGAKAALLSSLELPLAIFWGFLFFDEYLGLNHWIGGALIIFGVFFAQKKTRKSLLASAE